MAEGAVESEPAAPMRRWTRRRRRRCGGALLVGALALAVAAALLAFLAFGEGGNSSANAATSVTDNLLQVCVLFRHGDRTPTDSYPADPHKDYDWPDGIGALTNEGKRQMLATGERLRSRYDAFLGPLYSAEELKATSSAHDRCLMSAQTLLAGLLPPKGRQVWKPDLGWQPVPVRYTPREQDTMLAAKKECPKYNEELKNAYASPEIQELNEKNKELYEMLTTNTKKTIQSITDVEFLYNTLLIEKIHGLELPKWTEDVFPEKMKPLAAQSLAIFTHTNTMKRIRGGPLLKDIIDNMRSISEDPTKPHVKMFLYSAHDLTIVNMWRTLGFTELLEVGYGAALVFELRWLSKGINLEVKVLYYNSSAIKDPVDLKVPGCDEPCDLGSFMNIMQTVLPTDWEKECELQEQ